MTREQLIDQIRRTHPYRFRFRDVKPGDNAGRLVPEVPGWRAVERYEEFTALMAEPPGGVS